VWFFDVVGAMELALQWVVGYGERDWIEKVVGYDVNVCMRERFRALLCN